MNRSTPVNLRCRRCSNGLRLFENLGHEATDEELSRMMAEAEADGDSFISLAEFAELNAAIEEDLRLAFWVLNTDGSSAISVVELVCILLATISGRIGRGKSGRPTALPGRIHLPRVSLSRSADAPALPLPRCHLCPCPQQYFKRKGADA